jgi:hypothetical protein
VNSSSCAGFETTSSAPTTGIPCNSQFIYGSSHPYTKSRGNIIYTMLYSLTLYTTLLDGLWCESVPTCDYSYGGMFTTTSVRNLLFEGYTEPSILKYYDLKFSQKYNISLECVNASYNICGIKNYNCDNNGIKLLFPIYNETNQKNQKNQSLEFIMNYGKTQNDEYFAHDIIFNRLTNHLLWPFSQNSTIANSSIYEISSYEKKNVTFSLNQEEEEEEGKEIEKENLNLQSIISFLNPFWQAYAGWNSNDTEFLKYYSCLFRFLNGKPNLFNSCNNILYTGRDLLNRSLSLKYFHGNDTIYQFEDNGSSGGSGSISINSSLVMNQYQMYEWDGFFSYPYTYLGLVKGIDYNTLKTPYLFNEMSLMHLTLSQKTLLYSFQREFPLSIPLSTGTISSEIPLQFPVNVRRFVEDSTTWQPYRTAGIPVDSYGMPLKIPIGMSSLERFANFPVFADTPNCYGNYLWDGIEYTSIGGTKHTNQYTHRTFIDYDPVTGKAIRSATRQQVQVFIISFVILLMIFVVLFSLDYSPN